MVWENHGAYSMLKRLNYVIVAAVWMKIEMEDGDMGKLKKGDKAPDFALTDQNGATVKLSDYLGRKLLVYFYPKADTSGCTKQALQRPGCIARFQRPRCSGGRYQSR